MLIGNDPYRFDFIDLHLQMPAGAHLGYTHGICVDVEDNLFIFNQSPAAVMTFNRHGEFQRSWGEEFQHGAHGMRLTNEEHHQFLYLTDYELHQVVKTTLRGLVQWRIGMPPRREIYTTPSDFKPTDVCVAPNGDIYIFDGYGKPYVHVYDRKAKYQFSIGGPGSAEGQFNCPHGGWIDTRRAEPELYVADRGNHRIQVFSLEGKFRRIIAGNDIIEPCGFYQYYDEMWVADLQARLVVLDAKDKVAAVLGDNPEAPRTTGWPNIADKLVPGLFNSPHACCLDTRGDVYVAEWIKTGRVVKMVRKSELPVKARPGKAEMV